MKKFFLAMAALAALMLPSEGSLAQVVTQLPIYLQNNTGQVSDLGNGPLELRLLQGSAQIFTSQGSGIGSTSGSSTTLTLTATPAVPPIVGGLISATGITSGTTVSAFNGTTVITLSAAMTVAASTPLAWGAACPAAVGAAFPIMQVQAGVGGDLPLFTQARVCGASQYGAGATVLPFAIGAH